VSVSNNEFRIAEVAEALVDESSGLASVPHLQMNQGSRGAPRGYKIGAQRQFWNTFHEVSLTIPSVLARTADRLEVQFPESIHIYLDAVHNAQRPLTWSSMLCSREISKVVVQQLGLTMVLSSDSRLFNHKLCLV